MAWAPTDGEVGQWLRRLRAEAPHWGVLYDPGQMLWLAVQGRQTLLIARTPAELAGQITAHVHAAEGEGARFRLRRPPSGVVRDAGRRPRTARQRP
jgi:hypothetical protein